MIRVKTQKQIKGIKKSCNLAARTLDFIEPFVKSGVTTNFLNELCEKFIRDHGAIPAPLNYMGYPKATCISLNEVVCHGVPNDYELKEGDILNIDITTILYGYYGDTSRMFAVGKISEEAQYLLDVTKKCLEIGIKQVKPGNCYGNIGYEISRYAHLHGTTVVEAFSGHGVGLEFHEDPTVFHIAEKNSGPLMQIGHIFTIEPMLNLGSPEIQIDKNDGWTARTVDGKLSAQYEHTVLVVPNGVEVLT